MTEPQYEDKFVVVGKDDYEKSKWKNLFEDLENMGVISKEDYEKASPEEKKRYDELKDIIKDGNFFD